MMSDLRAPGHQTPPSPVLACLILLLGLYGWMLVENRIRNAGGADTSGYLNAARLIRSGDIVSEIEGPARLRWPSDESWVFIPLGMSRGQVPGTMVPYYPPGVPIQFAAAAEVMGWKRGPFLVSPIAGFVAVILTFFIARRLGLEFGYAVVAAAILALFPTFVFEAVTPMSDVIATAWVCATMLFALESRDSDRWAYAAGAALGMAILTRPTNGLVLIPLVLALPLRSAVILRVVVGGLPCGAFFLTYNQIAFGNPFRTGYSHDLATHDLSAEYFVMRSRHYVYWLSNLMTPLIPAGWLVASVDRRIEPRARLLLLTWFGSFFFFYCFYFFFDAWWYTRFLLPGLPAVTVAAMFAARDVADLNPSFRKATSDLVIRGTSISFAVLVIVFTTMASQIGSNHILDLDKNEKAYLKASVIAPMRIPEHSFVLAMQTSGAMSYYGGMTPIRWDVLEPWQISRVEDALQERALGLYALLFPFEEPEVFAKFPGEWRMVERYDYITLWTRTSG